MSDRNASPILPVNPVLLLAKQVLGMILLCAPLTFHNALYPAGPPVTLLTERGDFDVLA